MSIASRISAMQEHLRDDYDVLTLAGADLTNVDKNIVNLKPTWKERLLYFMNNGTQQVWDNWDKVTGEGTSISLNNTEEAPMSLVYKGNTLQNGTPTPDNPVPIQVVSGDNSIVVCGKNLVPFTNQDFTLKNVRYYVQDGSLYLNGTSTGETSSTSQEFKDNFTFTLPAGTYYASCGSNGRSYYLYNKTTNTSLFSNPNYVVGGTQRTFTLTEETTLYIGFYVYNNTFNNVNNEVMISKSATIYEPYTGESYPISLGVENLFDKVSATTQNQYTLNNDGTITSTRNWGNDGRTFFNNISLNAGTYTLSYIPNLSGSEKKERFSIKNATSNTDIINSTLDITNGTKMNYTFTLGSTANIQICIMANGTNGGTITLDKIQLEKGSKANSYSEYGTTPIELCKIGDYQDSIVKDNGKWYVNKQIGKVVLNGSENINTNSGYIANGRFDFYTITNGLKGSSGNPNCLSNYYKSNFSTNNGSIFLSGVDAHINIINIDYANDLAGFKTWLGTHNVILYYVLATPTYTEITDSTLLSQLNALAKSYEGQTNISQENNDLASILNATALEEME